MLCAEPKEHKRFRPGTRPGGIGFPAGRIGDRGDREIVYVPNVYVPFPAPSLELADFWGGETQTMVSLGCFGGRGRLEAPKGHPSKGHRWKSEILVKL